jgi:hypothetical protein
MKGASQASRCLRSSRCVDNSRLKMRVEGWELGSV